MNRELKFRAWNIPNKTMYMDIQNGVLCQNEKGHIVLGTSFGTICKDAGSKVMQFTGSVDNEGKEIYEGDIVELSNGFHPKLRPIIFDDYGAWSIGILGVSFGQMKANGFVHCKIVGNIYENPELLSE